MLARFNKKQHDWAKKISFFLEQLAWTTSLLWVFISNCFDWASVECQFVWRKKNVSLTMFFPPVFNSSTSLWAYSPGVAKLRLLELSEKLYICFLFLLQSLEISYNVTVAATSRCAVHYCFCKSFQKELWCRRSVIANKLVFLCCGSL